MTALAYFVGGFPNQPLKPETKLSSLRGFGGDDLGGLIIANEIATDGRVVPTDAPHSDEFGE